MTKSYLKEKKCCACGLRGDKKDRNHFRQLKSYNLVSKLKLAYSLETPIHIGDFVCEKCINKGRYQSKKKETNMTPSNNEIDQNEFIDDQYQMDPSCYYIPEKVNECKIIDTNEVLLGNNRQPNEMNLLLEESDVNLVKIQTVNSSHKKCFVCRESGSTKKHGKKLKTISENAIRNIFLSSKILISKGSRCCSCHLDKYNNLKREDIEKLQLIDKTSKLRQGTMEDLLLQFRDEHNHYQLINKFKSTETLSEDACKNVLGYSVNEFFSICDRLISMNDSPQRTKSQALAVYLYWLKSGHNQARVAAYFGNLKQTDVCRYCEQVRTSLSEYFVPENIGPSHLSREQWLSHNTQTVNEIYLKGEKRFVAVLDGTYVWCEKSMNNTFQRQTYSVHKKTHLVKPFVITAADGHIVDIYGLFEATKNDATIAVEILGREKELRELLRPNDTLIVDRGFRDCVSLLTNDYKLDVKMPSLAQDSDESQLSTLEANTSRLVTKCRWVVEARNGILKRSFKALSEVYNKELHHTIEDFRIAGAIVNKFHKSLHSDGIYAKEVAQKMAERLHVPNKLKEYALKRKTFSKKDFTRLTEASINDFPTLDIDDIENNITLGSFQVKMSLSYIAEHQNEHGNHEFYLKREDFDDHSKLIYSVVQSRHRNSTKYQVLIQYKPTDQKCPGNYENVLAWYCTCFVGARTVGCCSHVASIIFYLAYGQYEEHLKKPGESLSSIFYGKRIIEKSRHKPLRDTKKVNSCDKEDLVENNVSKDELEKTMSSLSIDGSQPLRSNSRLFNLISLSDIESYFPPWGGSLVKNDKVTKSSITNTCTIDYFLTCFWLSYLISDNVSNVFLSEGSSLLRIIRAIIDFINNKDWDRAKSMWIKDVLNMDLDQQGSVSLYGDEFEMVLKHLEKSQEYSISLTCHCGNEEFIIRDDVFLEFDTNNNPAISITSNRSCKLCLRKMKSFIAFTRTPPWLVIGNTQMHNICATDLPEEIKIDELSFKLLCATFFNENQNNPNLNHFKSVFFINGEAHVYDDCNPNYFDKTIPHHSVSSCFYYLS